MATKPTTVVAVHWPHDRKRVACGHTFKRSPTQRVAQAPTDVTCRRCMRILCRRRVLTPAQLPEDLPLGREIRRKWGLPQLPPRPSKW